MPENETNKMTEEVVEQETTQENVVEGAETEETATQETVQMQFQPQEFVNNLEYMGLGMLGIFVVIGVIITVTAALNKIFKK